MYRHNLKIGVLVAAVAVLVCGRVCGAGTVIENTSYAGAKTTIKYSVWGGPGEVKLIRRICNAFVAKNGNIRIETAVYPWGQYWAKLQIQTASDLAPDVIALTSSHIGSWVSRGALLPLDDLVEKSALRLEDYHQVAIECSRWDGKLYSMPMELPVMALAYSIDRFQQCGIDRRNQPQPDKAMTWQQFKTLAARLTLRRPDGTFSQYGIAGGSDWNNAMARMYGGRFVGRLINPTQSLVAGNKQLERALIEVFRTQYGKRFMLGAVPLASSGRSGEHLLSPKFAMMQVGPWALVALKEANVRFALTPSPRTSCPSYKVGLNSLGIFSHSKHPEEAWRFIAFMASDEVQPLFGRLLKGVPALKSAGKSLIDNDYGIKGCEAFLYHLPSAIPNMVTANTYVPAAISKWLAQSERILDREYDERLRALPRKDGAILEADYAAFVDGMDNFVADTISGRLGMLDSNIDKAFARGRSSSPGFFVKYIVPVIILIVIGAFLICYVLKVRSQHRSEKPGRRHNLAGYLFISPWLIGLTCFALGPILIAIVLSFTQWNMIKPPDWIGAQNFLSLLKDENFFIGLRRTFSYAILVIPISLLGGLFTAGLLTANIRGTSIFKAIFYFPSLFTGAATAVLWVNMFNKEYGIINRILGFVGMAPINWLDEGHAFFTVVLMNFFWIGGAMIIYYAGMKQIPKSLYEAADIDGAGPIRKYVSITIPMLSPVILFMVVMTTIGAFQVFTPALFFATNSSTIGEPGDSLRFYSVNVYDEAFNNLRMGRACCYAVILFIIIFLVTMIQMRLSKRFVHTEAE